MVKFSYTIDFAGSNVYRCGRQYENATEALAEAFETVFAMNEIAKTGVGAFLIQVQSCEWKNGGWLVSDYGTSYVIGETNPYTWDK